MFIFREERENSSVMRNRILRMLETRQAMHLGELQMRLGSEQKLVLEALESMVKEGVVEVMRPVNYHRSDHDFFRLRESEEELSRIPEPYRRQTGELPQNFVHLAGEAMACI